MKYILAISGGVDSVVLLDMVVNNRFEKLSLLIDKNQLIVAHFDHGIRKESKRDAEFVRSLAEKYDLPFVLGGAKLGAKASEDSARNARYDFLRSVATETEFGSIVTAHHQDDLIETIVMNILRGTGWKGLSPFWTSDILRPMMNMNKSDVVRYAIENNLDWVEDETNYQSKYFRNRIRSALCNVTSEQRKSMMELYIKQSSIRSDIEEILKNIPTLTESDPMRIEQIASMDDDIGLELLNKMTNGELTNPQTKRLLDFLRTANTGDVCQPGGGMQIIMQRGRMITRTDLKK